MLHGWHSLVAEFWRMTRVAGFGAFRASGRGGCSLGAGSGVIPAAGNVLGADYNPPGQAVIPGCGPKT